MVYAILNKTAIKGLLLVLTLAGCTYIISEQPYIIPDNVPIIQRSNRHKNVIIDKHEPATQQEENKSKSLVPQPPRG